MSALPTSDLRSDAKCYRRDRAYNTKWRNGARAAAGKTCRHDLSLVNLYTSTSCSQCAARPHSARSKIANRAMKRETQIATSGGRRFVNHVVLDTAMSGASDTSEDEVIDPSAAPENEIDVMYSYDAKHGPAAGSDVLSNAVMQAVKKFENKQTEQLVKNEYDLVLDGKDEDNYIGDIDDDFELVDHAHIA